MVTLNSLITIRIDEFVQIVEMLKLINEIQYQPEVYTYKIRINKYLMFSRVL